MQRVADEALAMIDGAEGVLVGLAVDAEELRYVCGAGHLSGRVGELLSLEDSLSGEAIRTGATLISDDTEIDPRVNRAATRSYHVRSSVCVPLRRGSEPVGVLNVSASRPRAFDEHDVALLSSLADFMSAVTGAAADFTAATVRLFAERRCGAAAQPPGTAGLGAEATRAGQFVANVLDPRGAEQSAARAQIERVLRTGDFSLVFQPIFDLDSGEAFAAEALTRFADGRGRPPDEWLAQAHRVGLGVDLEVAIVEAAVAYMDRLPGASLMTLNAGPQALASSRITNALARLDAERVVIELTEQVEVDDYPQLSDVLRGLRATGVRLAIDDAGAGFASLMHILKLAPDFIKLDRELIRGIDIDPVRRSLAMSLMRFAEETGAVIIAEGMETDAELTVLRGLGIRYGQGFHLARPGPISAVGQAVRKGADRVRGQARARSTPGRRLGLDYSASGGVVPRVGTTASPRPRA